MRQLRLGLPKIMVSTLASGDVAPYVDVSDVVMMPSVTDMAGLNRLGRMLRALLGKQDLNREMDEEMRIHLEMEAEELVRTRGLAPEEARRQAMLAFGGLQRFREEGRDARGVRVLEDLHAEHLAPVGVSGNPRRTR